MSSLHEMAVDFAERVEDLTARQIAAWLRERHREGRARADAARDVFDALPLAAEVAGLPAAADAIERGEWKTNTSPIPTPCQCGEATCFWCQGAAPTTEGGAPT